LTQLRPAGKHGDPDATGRDRDDDASILADQEIEQQIADRESGLERGEIGDGKGGDTFEGGPQRPGVRSLDHLDDLVGPSVSVLQREHGSQLGVRFQAAPQVGPSLLGEVQPGPAALDDLDRLAKQRFRVGIAIGVEHPGLAEQRARHPRDLFHLLAVGLLDHDGDATFRGLRPPGPQIDLRPEQLGEQRDVGQYVCARRAVEDSRGLLEPPLFQREPAPAEIGAGGLHGVVLGDPGIPGRRLVQRVDPQVQVPEHQRDPCNLASAVGRERLLVDLFRDLARFGRVSDVAQERRPVVGDQSRTACLTEPLQNLDGALRRVDRLREVARALVQAGEAVGHAGLQPVVAGLASRGNPLQVGRFGALGPLEPLQAARDAVGGTGDAQWIARGKCELPGAPVFLRAGTQAVVRGRGVDPQAAFGKGPGRLPAFGLVGREPDGDPPQVTHALGAFLGGLLQRFAECTEPRLSVGAARQQLVGDRWMGFSGGRGRQLGRGGGFRGRDGRRVGAAFQGGRPWRGLLHTRRAGRREHSQRRQHRQPT